MFEFMSMLGNHGSRAIDCYEVGGLFIDTCAVYDSSRPYETAVAHPAYNDGKLVIVEMYDTVKDAEGGHQRWVERMTAKNLPDSLCDVSTATIAALCATLAEDDNWRTHARQVISE